MASSKSKKNIRLTIMGTSGKMGQRIFSLAEKDSRFVLTAGVEKAGSAHVGRFIGSSSTLIVGDVSEVLGKTDVIIDFTSAESTLKTVQLAASKKVPVVIGTTGLSPAQLSKLKTYSKKVPLVFSPNMSVGVNLLFELVKQAAKALSHYDIEIIEAHHNLKKDAPSGTAMRLAEVVAEASQRSSRDFVFGREGMVGPRKKKEIGVFAVRAGDIVGDHTVLFSNTGERLELIHRAHSRDTFAAGALDAAYWVTQQKPGFYSMLDVLRRTLS